MRIDRVGVIWVPDSSDQVSPEDHLGKLAQTAIKGLKRIDPMKWDVNAKIGVAGPMPIGSVPKDGKKVGR